VGGQGLRKQKAAAHVPMLLLRLSAQHLAAGRMPGKAREEGEEEEEREESHKRNGTEAYNSVPSPLSIRPPPTPFQRPKGRVQATARHPQP